LWAWAGEVAGGDTDLVIEVEPLKIEEQDNGGPLLKGVDCEVESVTLIRPNGKASKIQVGAVDPETARLEAEADALAADME
jgi:hypothetical protein